MKAIKLLLFIAVFTMFGVAAHAQSGTGSAVPMPTVTGDTITNAGTVTKVLSYTGGYAGAVIQVNAHLISGTGAGTITIKGSNDGVYYTAIGSAYTITNTTNQAAYFSIAGPLPNFLEAVCTGSGTESTAIVVWYRNPYYQNQY